MDQKKKNITSSFSVKKCSGCGACVNCCPNEAISYCFDENGFTIPHVDESKCIGCNKCVRICPYNNIQSNETAISVIAAINKNDSVLLCSSSGGVFYEIAKHVLNKGGVVFGCIMDDNFIVKHTFIDSIDDLHLLMKSKYVQSFPGFNYRRVKEFLNNGKRVLFSGTPCMIAGLLSFLGDINYEGELITVDIVCHGVANQKMFSDYIEHLGSKNGKPIIKYTFRAKEKVKNGMECKLSYETKDEKYIRNWPEDSYNNYYMKAVIYRDSCYECPFASSHRYSDITICDFWGWADFKLPFDVSDSVSGIIINTSRGVAIFESIRNCFKIAESNFESISKHNRNLVKPCDKPVEREKILGIWKNDGFAALDNYFRKNNKFQIIKYRITRPLPYKLIYIVNKLIKRL